jgi:hypothetical protein
MRRALTAAVLAVLAVVAIAGAGAPAFAGRGHKGDKGERTTVVPDAGTLSISVPATADLGTTGPGSTAAGKLGTVTVSDTRNLLTVSWTASVISSDFTTGGGTPPETIPASVVSYWSGSATDTSGIGVFTPGQPNASLAVPIATSKAAFTVTLGIGNNSASWNPNLRIAVPLTALAGKYTGTVTHSVL